MWKKDEMGSPVPGSAQPVDPPPQHPSVRTAPAAGERATIGPSITIKGDVSGDEDLLIQGRIEGSVDLKLQSVTVGREGRVKANISGRIVTVEGEVEGDLRAQEQVILRGSARVQGDITAPRVVLEDGANFRGLVDMAEGVASGRKAESSGASGHDARKSSGPSPAEPTASSGMGGDGSSSTGTGGAAKDSGGGTSAKTPSRGGRDASGSAGAAS